MQSHYGFRFLLLFVLQQTIYALPTLHTSEHLAVPDCLLQHPEYSMTLSKWQEVGTEPDRVASQGVGTFLAPSNNAWKTLASQPHGKLLTSLLNGKNGKRVLRNLLLYHMIPKYRNSDVEIKSTKRRRLATDLLGSNHYPSWTRHSRVSSSPTLQLQEVPSKLNAMVVNREMCPRSSASLAVYGINRVLIPPDVGVLLTEPKAANSGSVQRSDSEEQRQPAGSSHTWLRGGGPSTNGGNGRRLLVTPSCIPSFPVSVDGSCGPAVATVCEADQCCSKDGRCGDWGNSSFCGTGCQPGFGMCSASSPAPAPCAPTPPSSPPPPSPPTSVHADQVPPSKSNGFPMTALLGIALATFALLVVGILVCHCWKNLRTGDPVNNDGVAGARSSTLFISAPSQNNHLCRGIPPAGASVKEEGGLAGDNLQTWHSG